MKRERPPRVSVVMPAYNSFAYVGEAISSVLSQTFGDWELIVIDDGSTDRTSEIVQSFADTRIRLYLNPTNLGIAMASNIGLALCSGEYVARMDSDDIAVPDRLATQAAFLDARPDITIVGSDAEVFGLNSYQSDVKEMDADIKSMLLIGRDHIHNCTAMFRRSFVDEHRIRYNASYVREGDHAFWVECLRHGARFANIKRVLLRRRWHGQNISKTAAGVAPRFHIQEQLVADLFPALTRADLPSVTALFREKQGWTIETARESIEAGRRALDYDGSVYGENRALVQNLLEERLRSLRALLAQRRT